MASAVTPSLTRQFRVDGPYMLTETNISLLFQRIASKVGAQQGFIDNLKHEKDWGFVIKMCIFVEALCTDVIVKTIGKTELMDYLSKLPLDGRSGKISIMENLRLANRETFKFVQGLGVIRNRYAHRIQYADVSLADFIAGMTSGNRQQLLSNFMHIVNSVDDKIPGLKGDPIYYRIIIESGFIYAVHDIASSSGLFDAVIDELHAEYNNFTELMRRTREVGRPDVAQKPELP